MVTHDAAASSGNFDTCVMHCKFYYDAAVMSVTRGGKCPSRPRTVEI